MKPTPAFAPARRKSGLEPLAAFSLARVFTFPVGQLRGRLFQSSDLAEDNQQTVHSYEVLIALDELLSGLQDAETGQRGFLLTDNDKYLEPYHMAVATVGSGIDRIAWLTQDNANQQTKIPSLKAHVAAKLAELEETVALRRTRGFEAALAVVNTDRGKVEMDAVRAELSTMAREETDLRDRRLGEMNQAYTTALATAIVSALLGIALTGIMGVLNRRATLARRREEWLRSGHLGLGAAMQGDQRVDQLGDSILGFLARYLDAVAGAVFVRDDKHYRRASTYGVPAGVSIPERFGLSVFSDWGVGGQAVPLACPASSHSRRSLASLRGRRWAAA